MKFTADKKQAIILYILEKIERGDKRISASVIDNFKINEATFYKYINELLEEKIIEKTARGQYQLSAKKYIYHLKRDNGDLNRDTIAYDKCLYKHVKGYGSNVEQIWAYTFSEMTNNVMDHSGALNMEVIVEQNHMTTTVWLMDDGIGIFRKIRDFFQLDSIDDAIDELFKGKTTTDPKNHSGEGIFFSSRMMDEFSIFSDDRVFSHDKYDQNVIRAEKFPFKTGTSVMMRLSNNSKRKPWEIFSRFENEEGEFDKTEIRMKMIFESSPVSRSQAKRLCNGLDRFRRVVLDFEDIEWMGQGFADQMFRVFNAEHPEITVTPINMNEDINKMYRHVKR